MVESTLPNTMPSKGTKNQNYPLLVGVIAVLLILGMFSYLFIKLSHTKVQDNKTVTVGTKVSLTPTDVPIIWGTYRNAQYGYTIASPSNWTVKKIGKNGQTLDTTIFTPLSGNYHAISILVDTKNSQNSLGNNSLVDTSRAISVNSVNGSEEVVPDSAGTQTMVARFPLTDRVVIVEANSNDASAFNHMVESLQFKK